MTCKATILMIEDNLDILRANAANLRLAQYRVLEATTLEAGRQLDRQERPDLILLDILLPDGNGLEYCRGGCSERIPRILFLSVLNTPEHIIAGLRAGGDDYMTKPYLMQELLARIEAILRRAHRTRHKPETLRVGSLELKTPIGRAYLAGRDLMLTPKEFSLLELMLAKPGQFTSSAQLYELVWGMQAVDTRPIRQHIRKLREKLGKNSPVIIQSEQGNGYRIVEAKPKSIQNITLES